MSVEPAPAVRAEHAPTAAPNAGAGRRPLLDGFRGLAILLIIAHHALGQDDDPTDPWLQRLVAHLASSLWAGVDCFFVLSGFLITGILLETRGRRRALSNFLARRVLRTFPLYYAVIFVCFVVLPHVLDPGWLSALSTRQGWFWLHASNFYSILHNVLAQDGPSVGWMSTFWSLSVEEHFYLAWAFVVTAVAPRRLGVVTVAALVGTFGLRVGLALSDESAAIYRLTFTRLDGLLLGSLLAVLSRRPEGLARHGLAARIVFAVSFVAFWVPVPSGFYQQTARISLAALMFASLFVLVLGAESAPRSPLHRLFAVRPLRAFGKYSYAMYVFNKPIMAGLMMLFFTTELPRAIGLGATMFVYFASALGLSFLAAVLSWHLLEKHALKLKRYFD